MAHQPGLRPTPDRVRETLFNWLGQDMSGWRCVDVFAGTGALGFEAASRGAKEVLMVERHAALVVQLKQIQTRLKASTVQVQHGDALVALGQLAAESVDVVFLDPPFDSDVHEPALRASVRVVTATGYVYLEAGQHWRDEQIMVMGLQVYRYLRAGAVHAHLLSRKTPEQSTKSVLTPVNTA